MSLAVRVRRLAATCEPVEAVRARRRMGEAGTPEAVVAALERRHRPMTAPPDRAPSADDRLLVVGEGMPERLAETWTQGGPLWVWWRGGDGGPGPVVGIVGTRRATHDGQRLAHEIGGGLAEAGVQVVSGMAKGIDQAAHRGALEAGGVTTAVLGTGLDVAYPSGSGSLRRQVAASGGLVTEHVHGYGVRRPSQFTDRNRILVGLVDALVVVEAGARSGALNSATWAANLGRDVLVVPASPSSPVAAGSLALLRDGATPVRHAADVCEELGIPGPGEAAVREVTVADHLRPVAELLGPQPVPIATLAARTGMPIRELLVAASALESAGLARRHPDGGLMAATR